jgi:hypothetical protein
MQNRGSCNVLNRKSPTLESRSQLISSKRVSVIAFRRKKWPASEEAGHERFCPARAVSTHIPFPIQEWITAAMRADFQ